VFHPSIYEYTYQLCSLLTFFMKLCLLRALITAVKVTFTPEDINAKDQVHVSPRSSHGSPCSFEQFLWEWNSFFLFRRHHHGGNITHNWSDLYPIVFADRTNFSHAMVDSSVRGYLSLSSGSVCCYTDFRCAAKRQ
jgi:hypothetical protein